MLIKNIKWDTDGDMVALASLPTEVYTPQFLREEQYDDIEEFLDDETDDGGIIKCDTLPK